MYSEPVMGGWEFGAYYIVGVLFEELLAAAGGGVAGELACDLGDSVDGCGGRVC